LKSHLTLGLVQVREGFIVDEEDEDEEGEEEGSDAESRPIKRKREHRDREEEARLDDEDLELIGEQFGERPKPESKVRWKACNLAMAFLLTSLVQIQTTQTWPS
jgi:hypothetical protein